MSAIYDGVILSNAASDKEHTNEIPMATVTKSMSNSTLVAVGAASASVATAAPAAKSWIGQNHYEHRD